MESEAKHIALIGGGPSALFMYKRLVESGAKIKVTIFEKSGRLGAGMPYSRCGSGNEHITNVSSNEIPELPVAPHEWIKMQQEKSMGTAISYSPYKVFPRKLFGDYLEAQFRTLISMGIQCGVATAVKHNTPVVDIQYENNKVTVITGRGKAYAFDKAVICTGHCFPNWLDEVATGYFLSPYPPEKLPRVLNHPVALRGASLTAIDAIKTLARANGVFTEKPNGTMIYRPNTESSGFKIVLHCRSGMLPAVRFHLTDTRLKNPSLLTEAQIEEHKKSNGGFLSLDFIFEKDFKEPLKESDPDFYEKIRNYTLEEFVQAMLNLREQVDPFTLLQAECREAAKSIKRKKSICWKEMLGVLSFALNYPAKYFSAEDMIRYKNTLHPLISLVIAYIPQSSCEELLALHREGCLDMVTVGKDSTVKKRAGGGVIYKYVDEQGKKICLEYQTYIDCTGQQQVDYTDFPFKSLANSGIVSQATLAFRNADAAIDYSTNHPDDIVTDNQGKRYLKVSGVAINDYFQPIGNSGEANDALYLMAVPLMGGYNPDYSGLDFAEEASQRIAKRMFSSPRTVALRARLPIQTKQAQARVA